MPKIMHIFAAATVAWCLAAPAMARDHNRARDAVQTGQARPLGQILDQVMNQCPGRFLDAGLRQGGGGLVYVIKILRPGPGHQAGGRRQVRRHPPRREIERPADHQGR